MHTGHAVEISESASNLGALQLLGWLPLVDYISTTWQQISFSLLLTFFFIETRDGKDVFKCLANALLPIPD